MERELSKGAPSSSHDANYHEKNPKTFHGTLFPCNERSRPRLPPADEAITDRNVHQRAGPDQHQLDRNYSTQSSPNYTSRLSPQASSRLLSFVTAAEGRLQLLHGSGKRTSYPPRPSADPSSYAMVIYTNVSVSPQCGPPLVEDAARTLHAMGSAPYSKRAYSQFTKDANIAARPTHSQPSQHNLNARLPGMKGLSTIDSLGCGSLHSLRRIQEQPVIPSLRDKYAPAVMAFPSKGGVETDAAFPMMPPSKNFLCATTAPVQGLSNRGCGFRLRPKKNCERYSEDNVGSQQQVSPNSQKCDPEHGVLRHGQQHSKKGFDRSDECTTSDGMQSHLQVCKQEANGQSMQLQRDQSSMPFQQSHTKQVLSPPHSGEKRSVQRQSSIGKRRTKDRQNLLPRIGSDHKRTAPDILRVTQVGSPTGRNRRGHAPSVREKYFQNRRTDTYELRGFSSNTASRSSGPTTGTEPPSFSSHPYRLNPSTPENSGPSNHEFTQKEHACQFPGCRKTFDRRYNLTVHYRRHTDEMPYPCKFEGCSQKFKWRSSQSHHMKTRHQISSYSRAVPVKPRFDASAAVAISKSAHSVRTVPSTSHREVLTTSSQVIALEVSPSEVVKTDSESNPKRTLQETDSRRGKYSPKKFRHSHKQNPL